LKNSQFNLEEILMEEKLTENQPLIKPQSSHIPYWIIFCA